MTPRHQTRELDDDACFEFYKSHLEYARFHEMRRERATRNVLIIAGVLLGLLSLESTDETLEIPLCLSIIGLGMCGLISTTTRTWKHVEHHKRAAVFYNQIMDADPVRLTGKGQAKGSRNRTHNRAVILAKRAERRRLPKARNRWLVINGLIILFGAIALLFNCGPWL